MFKQGFEKIATRWKDELAKRLLTKSKHKKDYVDHLEYLGLKKIHSKRIRKHMTNSLRNNYGGSTLFGGPGGYGLYQTQGMIPIPATFLEEFEKKKKLNKNRLFESSAPARKKSRPISKKMWNIIHGLSE